MVLREMKDSGIEWIGKIPKHWETIKCKYLMDIYSGEIISKLDLTDKKLFPVFGGGKQIGYYNKYNVIEGTIVVGRVGALCGCVTFTESKAWATDNALIVNCKKGNNKFWAYNLYSAELNKLNNSNAQPLITANKILNLSITMPSEIIQNKIADFLDKKCNEIDKLKIDIEKQIAILDDYKKSLITETVTKGLNPDVEMKDSGIEWIGEIPKQWQVKRIKYIATLSGRIGWQGLTSSEYCDEGAYLITGVNFSNGDIDWDSCVHISEERWEEAEQIQIKNDDLLITKDGTVGKIAIVRNMPGKTSLNSGVLLIRIEKSCDKKFLYWILKSNIFWKWFYTINSGNSTIIHLYQNDFYNFSFPLMDINEQKEIADFLDDKCTKIHEIIELKQKQIAKIDEYKKSLIYEYVTGKKEVH